MFFFFHLTFVYEHGIKPKNMGVLASQNCSKLYVIYNLYTYIQPF
jgi:hypothetical protein